MTPTPDIVAEARRVADYLAHVYAIIPGPMQRDELSSDAARLLRALAAIVERDDALIAACGGIPVTPCPCCQGDLACSDECTFATDCPGEARQLREWREWYKPIAAAIAAREGGGA